MSDPSPAATTAWKRLADCSPVALATTLSAQHLLSYANPSFLQLCAQESAAINERPFEEVLPTADASSLLTLLDRAYQQKENVCATDLEGIADPGEPVYWSFTVRPILDPAGEAEGLLIEVSDTTEQALLRRHYEQLGVQIRRIGDARSAAEQAERHFRALVDGLDAIIWEADAETGQLSYVNGRATELLGAPPVGETTERQYWWDLVHPTDQDRTITLSREAARTGEDFDFECRTETPDGEVVWLHNFVRVVSPPLVHARQLRGVTVDITERKAVEQQLERQAFADPVTALPNRALFMDRLAHAMRRRDRRPGGVVMLLMDLDRFKLINDAFGHAGGDELLRAVGERLQSCLRDEDTLARFGGDEFALLFGELPGAAPATELAERLLQRFQAPFLIQGREVRVSASMGIATSQGGVILPEDLLRNADVALYRAKAAGRARYVVFDQPIEADVARRSQLESELYLAQERGQFRLHYQPEVDLETASIVGVEVLLRWEHPERGLLLPGEFLALAEETGLILPIGRWVREEASRQMRAWNRARPGRTPLVLSVNLCAKEFQDPGLHAELNRLLSDSEADLAPLRLELTESILLDDLTQAAKSIGHLKQMGVQVALDDFGTGFSSLGYLRHLPVDVLKIDRTFVEELGTDETSGAIVKAIIELGHALQMEITVEGIETRVQWEGVQQTSCARGQGYYFFSPVEGAQMAPLLA